MNYYFKCWKDRNENCMKKQSRGKEYRLAEKEKARFLEGYYLQVRKVAIEKNVFRNVYNRACQNMDLCYERN